MIRFCLILFALLILNQADSAYSSPTEDLYDYEDLEDGSLGPYNGALMHRDRRFLIGLPGPRRRLHRTRRSEDDLEDDLEGGGDIQKRFLLGLPARSLQRHNRKRFLLGLPARTRLT